MPAIVALPQVVEELLIQFGDVFPNGRHGFISPST
jgi:hypothetical protein